MNILCPRDVKCVNLVFSLNVLILFSLLQLVEVLKTPLLEPEMDNTGF